MNSKALAIVAVIAILVFVLVYALPTRTGEPSYTTNTNTNQRELSPTTTPIDSTNTNSNANTSVQPEAQAVAAVKTYAAVRYSVGENEVIVISAISRSWSDSCLGAAKPGELCAQVITLGYLVTVNVQGSAHIYHTNDSGAVIREEVVPTPLPEPPKAGQTTFTKLHMSCKQDSDCDPGVPCIGFYGFAGPVGLQFTGCEIRCTSNTQCPAGLTCGTIADGPGQVCM